jgi:hypothetical protein
MALTLFFIRFLSPGALSQDAGDVDSTAAVLIIFLGSKNPSCCEGMEFQKS